MPQPLVLSAEDSHLPASFGGFKPGECVHCDWLHSTHDGYQQVHETSMSGEVVGAHRKVYALFNGPLGKYDIVSHACGDRTCLNPYHLFISGRHPCPRDFDFAHDKRFRLSSEGLARIADLSKSVSELALELGVHPNTVASRRADLRHALRCSALALP
ncbi:HNH endonuclease [Roseateles sp. DC23W]|uniref:HNH endonuclease n=1 Tax=Pelomonas dachongensis TaxID=3299029 RepID=A0ABW7EPS2_9BURK